MNGVCPPLSKYSGVSGMGFPRVTTKPPTPPPPRSGVSPRKRGGVAWGCSPTGGDRGGEGCWSLRRLGPPAPPRSQRPPPARGASHRRHRLLRAALRVLQRDHASAAVVAAAWQGLLAAEQEVTGAQRRAGAEPGGWTRRAGAEVTKPARSRAAGSGHPAPGDKRDSRGGGRGPRPRPQAAGVGWGRTHSLEEQTGKLTGGGWVA